MSLVVKGTMTASPSSLPPAGGTTTLTFEALSTAGNSRLQATFDTGPGATFEIVGSNSLGSQPVPSTFKSYDKSLVLHPRPGVPPGAVVIIEAQVQEVDASGSPIGGPRTATGTVDIQLGQGMHLAAAAVVGAVAGAAAGAAAAAVLSGGGAAPQDEELDEDAPEFED